MPHDYTAPLFGTSHTARFWLSLDCCGLTCAAATEAMVIYSQCVMTRELCIRQIGWYKIHVLLFNVLATLSILSHLRAMFSDPGAVPRQAEPLERDTARAKMAASAAAGLRTRAKGWCHRCRGYKPPRAHHDSVTGRCIVKLDHFCPWTNNAIGVRNHKLFLLFLLYVCLLCFHALGILALFAFHPSPDDTLNKSSLPLEEASKKDQLPTKSKRLRRDNTYEDDDIPLLLPSASLCFVALFAVLFGLFTFIMLCDQWSVVTTHVAKIDRLKGDADDLDAYSGVNEIFGGTTNRCRLEWLVPTLPRFPNSVRDEILGYQTAPNSKVWLDPEIGADGSSLPENNPTLATSTTTKKSQSSPVITLPGKSNAAHLSSPPCEKDNLLMIHSSPLAMATSAVPIEESKSVPSISAIHSDDVRSTSPVPDIREKATTITSESNPQKDASSSSITPSSPAEASSSLMSLGSLLGRLLPVSEKKTTRHAE